MEEIKPCVKCGAADRYEKSGKCRPCRAKNNAKWKAANPERLMGHNAKHYAANTEKLKAARIKYYTENPAKANAASAKWRTANPETCRIYSHNRRAHKIANGGKLSNNLAEILYLRQKGRCACCQKPLGDSYHLDHIMPLSLGGANEDWNIQLLRPSCNSSKGAKHPVEYMQSRGLLI